MPPVCLHVPAVIMMYLFVLILCFSAPNDPTSRRWLWNSAIFFPWADMVRSWPNSVNSIEIRFTNQAIIMIIMPEYLFNSNLNLYIYIIQI